VVTVSPSPNLVDNISSNHLDTFHAYAFYSLSSPPPEYRNMLPTDYHDMLEWNVVDCLESLSTFSGYDSSLDP